ncbi:hypothetical protein [Acidiplasma sp.]|uniref:hypothetical protein n=1 Tax=Acidiplasma sp. TaxID=1872114 RepID=UPI00258AF0F0|nr:hypothetical protein [Acidiplasma sp.]
MIKEKHAGGSVRYSEYLQQDEDLKDLSISVYFLFLSSSGIILSMISIINGICFRGISQYSNSVNNVRCLSDYSGKARHPIIII